MMYQKVGNILKPVMNDLQKHKLKKQAKVYVEHLEAILKTISLTIRALKFFEVYNSVQRILNVLREEKILLEQQLKTQKDIIKDSK